MDINNRRRGPTEAANEASSSSIKVKLVGMVKVRQPLEVKVEVMWVICVKVTMVVTIGVKVKTSIDGYHFCWP